MKNERKIHSIHHGAPFHWVGDGFRVTNYFPSGTDFEHRISPFLLMDYHAPYTYSPTNGKQRGVGAHPHRGFETVTLAFEGSVAHHDSAGNSGVIGPGDVQWMTAASGILHSEYHEENFSRNGGDMHMMQLWVNLPKAHKMDAPRYQGIAADDIGRFILPERGGEVRVIAGRYKSVRGPAMTFTPINLFDIRLNAGGRVEMSFPARENTALLVMKGEVKINGETVAGALDFVMFDNVGQDIVAEATSEAQLLLLNGEPIDEPVAMYGPFVMNTEQEILQAMNDVRAGKFGRLAG